MSSQPECVFNAEWLELTQCLLDSFTRWTGGTLIQRGSMQDDSENLWCTSKVVVAHGTQSDPAFIYGNQIALDLWEIGLEEFLGMPSRLTAEPIHRDERQRLLEQTKQHGFVDDYRGIRISRSGKRFMIEKALLWMVLDKNGIIIGQAATFDHWTPLDH